MLFKIQLKVKVRFNLEAYTLYLYIFLKDPVPSNEDVVKVRIQEKTMCFVKDTKKQKVILSVNLVQNDQQKHKKVL